MQNRIVTFRLSEREFSQISSHSARAGMSISASVRALVVDAIADKKTDQVIKSLAAIEAKLNEKPDATDVPQDAQVAKIAKALAGLIDNVFLPAAPVDRKAQIKQIAQTLVE
jgi:hypothetical protein